MHKILDILPTRDELNDEGAEKRMQLMEWCAFRKPFADKSLKNDSKKIRL